MDAAILCEGLSKNYGEVKALKNLNLEIKSNLVLGFLGVNGAGKTTTIKLLNSLIKPTSGRAFVCGIPIDENQMAIKTLVGYLSQEPAFYHWMTGKEFLHYVGSIFGIKKSLLKDRVSSLLEEVGLSDSGNRRIGGYSTGMKQRLGIAQALINEPKVLFLDEPVSSLDSVGRVHVLEIVKSLKGKATIFMSSHILNDIERVCDEVAIIDKGELVIHEKLSRLKEKYISAAVLIQCKEPLEKFKDLLEQEDYIQHVEFPDAEGKDGKEKFSLRIVFKDFEKGKRVLPKLVVDSGLTLIKYEMLTPTLEDVFMKLINKGEKGGESA